MADAPAPAPAIFRLSRTKPMQSLLLGAAVLVVVSIWMLIEHGRAGLFGVALALGLFALWNHQTARERAEAEADRAPKLTVAADGLTIPDQFSEPVPWPEIESLSLYSGKSSAFLGLRVAAPERFGFVPHAGQAFARLLGDRSIAFDYAGLDCDRAALRAALLRHAPARLTKGL